MAGPTIEQLAQEYEGRASVGKVNVDEEGGLAGDFGVMSIPTVVLFKDGRKWNAWWVCVRSRNIKRLSTLICKRVSRRSLRTGSAVSKRQNQTGSFVASV